MAIKQATKAIKKAVKIKKKPKVSGPAKGLPKSKSGNVRKRTSLNKKAVSREGFDPAKAEAAKAKGVTVTKIKPPLTPAQGRANDAAVKAGKRASANPKVDTTKKVTKKPKQGKIQGPKTRTQQATANANAKIADNAKAVGLGVRAYKKKFPEVAKQEVKRATTAIKRKVATVNKGKPAVKAAKEKVARAKVATKKTPVKKAVKKTPVKKAVKKTPLKLANGVNNSKTKLNLKTNRETAGQTQSRGYGANSAATSGGGSSTKSSAGSYSTVSGAEAFKAGYKAGKPSIAKVKKKIRVKTAKARKVAKKVAKSPYGVIGGWEATKYGVNKVMGSSPTTQQPATQQPAVKPATQQPTTKPATQQPVDKPAAKPAAQKPTYNRNFFTPEEMKAARQRVEARKNYYNKK